MEEKKFNLPAAIIVSLTVTVALVVVSLVQDESALKSLKMSLIEIGTQAPNFRFPGLDGKNTSLSDHEGKVVLVNIWATWCPPCVEEMPSMQRLYTKFKGKDFEILAVSIDAAGIDAVAPFMKKHKLSFPALMDTKGSIRSMYGVTGVPESYIIDKKGVLIGKVIGARDWSSPQIFRFFQELVDTPWQSTDPDTKG